MAHNRTVLLLGNGRVALSVVRALAPLGYRLVMGLDPKGGGAEYSRFTHAYWDHPSVRTDSAGFFDALDGLLDDRPDILIIFPVHETYVHALAEHSQRLRSDRLYAMARPGLIKRCHDKISMMQLARDCSIPLEPFAAAETYEQLLCQANLLGFPLVVRANCSTDRLTGEKAVFCRDLQELGAKFPAWPAHQQKLVVQRRARGKRFNIHFAAREGKILSSRELSVERTHRPNGAGLAVFGYGATPSETLLGYTRQLVKALNYTGVAAAQFLVERRTGRVSFLEVNPRLAGSNAVQEALGMETSRLTIDLAAGAKPPASDRAVETNGQPKRFAWILGDLGGLRKALGNREVNTVQAVGWAGCILRSLLTAQIHEIWSWSDPLPAVMKIGDAAVPGWGRFMQRICLRGRSIQPLNGTSRRKACR